MSEFAFKNSNSNINRSQERKSKSIRVYFQRNPHTKVKLKFRENEIAKRNVEEFIDFIIRTIQSEYLISVCDETDNYRLYPANKSGQKKDDFPAIQPSQQLRNLHFQRFYLQEKDQSYSKITSEFNLEKKYGFEKVDSFEGCCLFNRKY